MNRVARSVLILANASIREALQSLCVTGKQALFVTEVDGKLVAALSDGDVRRFLLAGGDIDAPVLRAANPKPTFLMDTERRLAQSVLHERHLSAVPIVDENMRVLDVEFLYDSVNVDEARIRVLGRADLPMVLDFFDQMAGDTRAMFNRGDVNRLRAIEHLNRKNDDGQVHFAAVVPNEDGTEKMVGYVFLWDIDRKIPWLGIAVREDWKGHHLGRRLLEHLDGWAKPKGYGGLMLTSVPANVRAHSLYTRMGFEYFGVYPDSEFLYIKRYTSGE